MPSVLMPLSILLSVLALATSAQAGARTTASGRPPLVIAKEGWFFVGGHIDPSQPDHPELGQIYVEYQVPARQTHPYPVIMIHGAFQSGINFTGTPDGREGWSQYFLRHGYAVYVVDQPGRGRSPYFASAYGPQTYPGLKATQEHFTAPEKVQLYPQAHLHNQWPGGSDPDDPAFSNFYAGELPSISDVLASQRMMRDAGAALLDRIGPSIVLVHSQAGLYGWSIAQVRPALVRALVAVEPSGPPVYDLQDVGAPTWFKYGAQAKPSGLGLLPLRYEPPLKEGEQLDFAPGAAPLAPGHVQCWAQRGPARQLAAMSSLPILMITAEASYHAPFDDCTAAYLRQAGAQQLDHIHLADVGIHGNGHMMMLEKNSDAIAQVIIRWLGKRERNGATGTPRT